MNDLEEKKEMLEDVNQEINDALKIQEDLGGNGSPILKAIKVIIKIATGILGGFFLFKGIRDFVKERKQKKEDKRNAKEAEILERAGKEAERRRAQEHPEEYATYSEEEYEPVKNN